MATEVSLPLHRKYRPYKLVGYLGNVENKEKIKKALDSDVRPQVILLKGGSGQGKTTLARLIAKEYTCINRQNIGCSCDNCEYCKSAINLIKTGERDSFSNIKEIDITEQSGKNALADTLEDMYVPTFENEWKVYILDEVHMASQALQNRLLKIAEEPPKNILIIMCTTRPDKIIDTLRNRCQLTLTVEKPTSADLGGYLSFVCSQEKVAFDNRGLSLIIKKANLVPRTALIILEDLIKTKNSAEYDAISDKIGEISNSDMSKFIIALRTKDTFSYITILNKIKTTIDLSVFLEQIKKYVCDGIYALNSVNIDATEDELKDLRRTFADMGTEQITVLLNRLLHIDTNNLELDLLTLGYTGLVLPSYNNSTQSVSTIKNETEMENTTAKKEVAKREEEEDKKALEDIKSSNVPITEDILMQMGATLVSE